MLWILRTGAPWRDLPSRYGAWETVAGRFYRWSKSGLWQRILQSLHQQANALGQLDWKVHHVDGSEIPCTPSCSRGKKGELVSDSELSKIEQVQHREAKVRSKGGFSTKIHLRARWQWLTCDIPNHYW